MALTPGTKLGPYEIQSPLGAGGMGEVYRAKDSRLDRTVAIKVLPSHLSTPELKLRFEREAKLISALQHANICTLHDVGSQDGVGFLVMEYIEGQTLADRLERGSLPLDQLLKIGVEIAQALHKAHQQGIIHRDLKPGNIMLSRSGAKLMDFGLAKPELGIGFGSIEPLSPSTPTMNLASLTSAASPLTQKGSIIGTFQYLAPEILQGGEADVRSDIFAFGCVLYEMATGRRTFEGKSQLAVMTAILEKEPAPINGAEQTVPPALVRIIETCLLKDPAERFQSAHDVAADLGWVKEFSTKEAAKGVRGFSNSTWALFALVLLSCVALAAGAALWLARSETVAPLHAEIPPPDKYSFASTGDNGGAPVLSPQGDKIAFVAQASNDKALWIRSTQSDSARKLEGTQRAAHPFWSPDGRYVGFFMNGKLAKIAASGGPVALLADAPNARGGAWGANDVILFSPNYLGPLMKLNAEGGSPPVAATVLDKSKHTTHRWPTFLPDGKHFLFLTASHSGGNPKENGIYLGSVDSGETHMVVATDASAQYASGYLLYRNNAALVAQPFNTGSGKLSGTATPLFDNIRFDSGVWRTIFTASQTGLILYQTENASNAGTRLVWFDRSGKKLNTFDVNERSIIDIRLSPDKKKVAFATQNPNPGVWTYDLERNTKTRITFDDKQAVAEPSWSPDGKMLTFTVATLQGGANLDIRIKAADGSGTERTVTSVPHNYHYPRWSPDGKYLTYLVGVGSNTVTLWAIPVVGDDKPIAIVRPPSEQFNINSYAVSPDSRWIAYASDESGAEELYVTTFPDAKGKWKVSSNGGAYPSWSGNGRELYFRSPTNDILFCTVTVKGSELLIGDQKHLFSAGMLGVGVPYDVRADGQRFLVNLGEEESPAPLELEVNWPSQLKERLNH